MTQRHTFIIAEVGLNHNGNLDLARESVAAAAHAGCDAVKFQNFKTEDFVRDRTQMFTYKSQGTEVTEPFFDLCKRNEFQPEWLGPLKSLCDEIGVELISTPTSIDGIEDLRRAGCTYVKNGSDYLTHPPLIRAMGQSGMKVILSTGMGTQDDIDAAVLALGAAYPDNAVLLHCTSAYPTHPQDINLNRMVRLQSHYDCAVGFSDHTEGSIAAVQAASLGAAMIEKHFTLDHELPGPDHWFSSTPGEMAELVSDVRQAEVRLGSGDLVPAAGELETRDAFRIGVVAEIDLDTGHVLGAGDFAFRKPGSGLLPRDIDDYLGRTLVRRVPKESPLSPEDFG